MAERDGSRHAPSAPTCARPVAERQPLTDTLLRSTRLHATSALRPLAAPSGLLWGVRRLPKLPADRPPAPRQGVCCALHPGDGSCEQRHCRANATCVSWLTRACHCDRVCEPGGAGCTRTLVGCGSTTTCRQSPAGARARGPVQETPPQHVGDTGSDGTRPPAAP